MSDVTRDEGEPQESSDETSAEPEESTAGEDRLDGAEDEEAKPSVTDQPKRARSAPSGKVAAPQPLSEERLNAPSMQTFGMLSVVAAATLVMWAAGRAACNYHEPGESLSPRAMTLQARTKTPKDVAFELSQRWLTADFDTAEKLVGPELLPAVQKDRASCTGEACARRKAATALSAAIVLAGNPVDTLVSVRTTGLPGGEVTKLFQVERAGNEWKVTRELDPKAPLPPLKEPPAGMMAPTGGPVLLQPGQMPGVAPAGSAPLVVPVVPQGTAAPTPPAAPTAPVAPTPAAPAPAPQKP